MATNATIFVFIESDGVIVIFSAGQHFPVSQYCGEIRLSQVDNGTELLWTVSFEQRVPGTGLSP